MSSPSSIAFRQAGADDAAGIADTHFQTHGETYLPLVGLEHYDAVSYEARLARWTAALQGEGIAFVALD